MQKLKEIDFEVILLLTNYHHGAQHIVWLRGKVAPGVESRGKHLQV